MSELLTAPDSEVPLLVRLRSEYAKAREIYAEADAWEDETGEPIPHDIRQHLGKVADQLYREEARLASLEPSPPSLPPP